MRRLGGALLVAGGSLLLSAMPPAAASPLFDTNDTLALTIEAPIRDLVVQRKEAPKHAGAVRYTDATGKLVSLPVEVSVRGHSRLRACDFPPVKLKFDAEQTGDTLFAGLRSLKLVTRCKRKLAARDWVTLEYGAYRAYNAITPFSYRVRRLELTWQDTDPGGAERRQIAFFIEPDNHVEARLARVNVRPPEVLPQQYSLPETTHFMLFQYLIGNTDFAIKRGPRGEGCCHNGRAFAVAGTDRDFVVLPYDFDQSGVVDADYAQADRRLGISQVTERVYRGFCWHNDYLADSVRAYNERRAEIEAAFPPATMSKKQYRRVQRYIRNFYKTINDPEELQSRLLDKCRGPDSFSPQASPESPDHPGTP